MYGTASWGWLHLFAAKKQKAPAGNDGGLFYVLFRKEYYFFTNTVRKNTSPLRLI